MADVATQTRFERVRAILDKAAGSSAADYGGVGRFWQLPIEDLVEVRIGGELMIARAMTTESCCCSATAQSADAAPERCEGRGAASGLVRGLRGEPPFDSTQYPPLPWGGSAVAEADIAFISDWIDDGCPVDDHEIGAYSMAPEAAAPIELALLERGNVEPIVKEAFNVFSGAPNAYKAQHGELKQRMNIDCMTADQLDALRSAFRELYHLNKWPEDSRSYNNLALIHQNHCQHGWERFLPWHRVYLYEFEQAMQDHFPEVTMPYWDWTMPQYRPHQPEKGWIIPKSLQAFLTDASLVYLTDIARPSLPSAEAAKLEELVYDPADGGPLFTSLQRFFAAVVAQGVPESYVTGPHRNRFIDALLASNALWYPLRYPAEYQSNGKPSTINKVIHYHYPTADDIEQLLSLRSFRDFGGGSLYNDSFGFLDQNPHNTLHIWTGGMNPDHGKDAIDFGRDLAYDRNRGVRVAGRQFHSRSDMYGQPQYGDMFSNLTAAYDPVFWPVHANVDRLWWEWQQRHPHSVPADLDSVLTPWSYTIADTLDMHRFGYEYVKMTYLIPVGLESPVGRFLSTPIDLPQAVRDSFHQAEVRLHRVPQLPRSCFVRVFLNLPDANALTPLDDPHYAGYLAVFGHGPCYGGPGHCDIPPRHGRPYDRRPRHHNTPRNHRINVTDAARRLIADGATRLQVSLVVIGVDYEEDHELLRLDGVSLNFLD